MCIAVYKPKNIVLTKKVVKTCFENNPHGAGMAFASQDGKRVIIEKGYFHFREFWKKFQQIQTNKAMLIHFRVATSGIIDKKNCHPWRIDERHAIIHNGVVANKIGIGSKDCSDTGLFVKHLLKPMFLQNDTFWKTSAFRWIIEQAMGKNNKFALLDNNESHVIFNEEEGKWEHGVWFSNDTYKNARKSLAKISDSWLEDRNGHLVLVKKKGNNNTVYQYVKNPLSLESESDVKPHEPHLNKIMKFVKNQITLTKDEDETLNKNLIELTALI